MDSFMEYDIKSAEKYHSWYEAGDGREIGAGQREVLKRALGEPGMRRLLEVGCGTGYFTGWLHRQGFNVTGIDNSAAMIDFARKKYGNGFEFRVGDAVNLPFTDDYFDVLVFATSFEFISDAVSAACEAERVARSEIILLLLNPDDPMNIKRKERDEFGGGVFRDASLRRPNEVKALFEEAGLHCWSGSCIAEPDGNSYYIMRIIRNQKVE